MNKWHQNFLNQPLLKWHDNNISHPTKIPPPPLALSPATGHRASRRLQQIPLVVQVFERPQSIVEARPQSYSVGMFLASEFGMHPRFFPAEWRQVDQVTLVASWPTELNTFIWKKQFSRRHKVIGSCAWWLQFWWMIGLYVPGAAKILPPAIRIRSSNTSLIEPGWYHTNFNITRPYQ